jgi:GMP synthase (glutamine-hydrolysing)
MYSSLQYLLLQVRNEKDPMREQEVRCFARFLQTSPAQIALVDLLQRPPTTSELAKADVVLLGGSGDYSVAEGGPWLESALESMRELHAMAKPTFASCWGFQAMARAMGGEVVRDVSRAEVGTAEIHLTPAGEDDPVFGPMGSPFLAQVGHQDIVDQLPEDAVLLASNNRVENQAFRFEGLPIYCTQFHPELNQELLMDRLRTYPRYVEQIVGMPMAEFIKTTRESFETQELLLRFVDEHVLGNR